MKKPKPSETISTGMPRRLGAPDERDEARIVRLRGRSRKERGRLDIDHRHLELHQPARAHQAGVIGGDLVLPDARHVLGHDRVRDVGQGDRPVVVDEDGQRRFTGEQRRNGRSRAVRTGHRARAPIARDRAAAARPRAAPQQRHTREDDRAADDLDRPDRLAEEDRRHRDSECRHQELEGGDAGRSEQLHAVEDDDVGEPGRERPGIQDGQEHGRPEVRETPDRSADTSWAIPSGAMKTVPATIAHVVVINGEWRRRIVAPNTV